MRRRRPGTGTLVAAAVLAGGCTGSVEVSDPHGLTLYAESYVAAVREAEGDARRAAEAFARAAALSPDEPLWRVAEGEAWIDAGAVARGLVTLRAAADAADLDPGPRLRLAHAIWFATGNRPVAEAELQTAAARFPADWRVLDAWTELLTAWEGPHAAAAKWEAAEGDLAAPDVARWRAGLAWTEAGDHRRALAAWLRIDRPDSAARARIASAALEAGQLEQALAYSSPADPSIEGRKVHAAARERRREWTEAVTAWRAVLDLDPKHVEAHLRLGHVLLLELSDAAAAEPHVLQALRWSKIRGTPAGRRQQRAQLLRGRWAERAGDAADAVSAYRELHRMNPSPEHAGRLGRALWRAGRDAAAARAAAPLLAEATSLIPSHELWWCLAECHRALEAWANARAAYRAAGDAGRPQAEVDAALAALPPE